MVLLLLLFVRSLLLLLIKLFNYLLLLLKQVKELHIFVWLLELGVLKLNRVRDFSRKYGILSWLIRRWFCSNAILVTHLSEAVTWWWLTVALLRWRITRWLFTCKTNISYHHLTSLHFSQEWLYAPGKHLVVSFVVNVCVVDHHILLIQNLW